MVVKGNKQTGGGNSGSDGGGALYVEHEVTVNIRESTFTENEATADSGSGKHGHQVLTFKGNYGTPSFTIVNTQFTDIVGDHAFYGYDNSDNTHGTDKFVTPAVCADADPCTEAPFTGTCADVTEGVGMICPDTTTCAVENTFFRTGIDSMCLSHATSQAQCDTGVFVAGTGTIQTDACLSIWNEETTGLYYVQDITLTSTMV